MTCPGQEVIKTIEGYSYSTGNRIGRGFSSEVYQGSNNQDNGQVAIKVIDLRKLQKKAMHQLLQSEISIVKTLSHPNILKCDSVFLTINNCYIITELCRDGDLSTLIKKKGRLRGMEALRIMLQIAKGYAYLTNINVIHRDIKPANILLNKGTVKIADFGFARYQKNCRKETYSVGSPLYMSPQALNNNLYSKQGDVWSLGIVFYEILQGRAPWDPKNEKQLRQILQTKPEIIFRIAIRDELETMIKQCLSYQRQSRISPDAILETLELLMKQMNKNDSQEAYRQTLTRRPSSTSIGMSANLSGISSHLSMPRIPLAQPKQQIFKQIDNCTNMSKLILQKLNHNNRSTTQLNSLNSLKVRHTPSNSSHNLLTYRQQESNITSKKQTLHTKPEESSVSKKQNHLSETKQHEIMTVQEASRYNHKILKALINFARFIYKLFPKLKQINKQKWLLQRIQIEMIAILNFTMHTLSSNLKKQNNLENAYKQIGVVMFSKFIQTRCYTKTILVVQEYFARYTNFLKKKQFELITPQNPIKIPKFTAFSDFKNSSERIKDVLKLFQPIVSSEEVDPKKSQAHNIGIDFLISLVILLKMLSTEDIHNFAQHSNIEIIVDTGAASLSPKNIIELKEKFQKVLLVQ